MSSKRRRRRLLGDVIAIALGDGTSSYGRVLQEPLIAFYDLRSEEILPFEGVLSSPIAFVLFVMNYPITHGIWPVLGSAPLAGSLLDEPLFFERDSISGALTIYRNSTGEDIPATREQCKNLECAAVWDPSHMVSRLQDHFAGRPNKWVESLRR